LVRTSDSIILAGAATVGAAGNAVSSEVLLAALSPLAEVVLLTHRHRLIPRIEATNGAGARRIQVGAQPISVHGEALLAGFLHRSLLKEHAAAWAVNSRYAAALMAAGIPYVVWEATLIRDELAAADVRSIRRGGTGSGAGLVLHRALLPIDERLEGLIYRRAAMVFAMSQYTRDRILARHELDSTAVQVLPHPPTPSFLAALERCPPRSAQRGERLLFVGRADDPRKGFSLLLDAFRRIRASDRSVTLTVIGPYSTTWRNQLRIASEGEGITFRGRVSTEDLAAAYVDNDLLVVPSRQEGFGIVVAEALHAGLPVVVTRCGGPEAVVTDSGAGMLVSHAPEEMSAVIVSLLRDDEQRRQLGRQAVAYARRVLAFEVFAERVASITTRLRTGALASAATL
jgi:glycosyltransferase involved in cell wall biosynthesis